MARKAKEHRPVPSVLFTFADGKPASVSSKNGAKDGIDIMQHAAELEAMAYYLDLAGYEALDEARDALILETVRKAIQCAFRQMNEPLREGIDKLLSDHDKGRKDAGRQGREAEIVKRAAAECQRRIRARKETEPPTKAEVARAVEKWFTKTHPGERGYSGDTILKVLYRLDAWPPDAGDLIAVATPQQIKHGRMA